VQQTIFEFRPDEAPQEYLLVQANNDGGAVISVKSLGGGRASIDLPVDQLADLGRKLLTRAAAYV
jgi:hypothetical protein